MIIGWFHFCARKECTQDRLPGKPLHELRCRFRAVATTDVPQQLPLPGTLLVDIDSQDAPRQGAIPNATPSGEDSLEEQVQFRADHLVQAALVDQLLEIAAQMRPTQLPPADRQILVGTPVITCKEDADRFPHRVGLPSRCTAGMQHDDCDVVRSGIHNQHFGPCFFEPVSSERLMGVFCTT